MSAPLDRAEVDDLAPLVRRAVDLDASTLVRLRRGGGRLSVLARLPFGVLVARTIEAGRADPVDSTVRGTELLTWLDTPGAEYPAAQDSQWRSGSPPVDGWRRLDRVPDTDIRPLVRSGALTLKEAAAREGVPGAQPREAVADALLDSVVLTVHDGTDSVGITLRALSALTRMGFLARGSHAAIDVAGRWIRVAAVYGTVYVERPGASLTLR